MNCCPNSDSNELHLTGGAMQRCIELISFVWVFGSSDFSGSSGPAKQTKYTKHTK
jgi:hypothetical protein